MIVAIDGPSGVGKSSTARSVAVALKIHHVDSGALYRAITLHIFSNLAVSPATDMHRVSGTLSDGLVTVKWVDGKQWTYLEDKNVTEQIREAIIAKNVKYVAGSKECRNFVNKILKSTASNHSIVIDGRDIGTVVFPNAEHKFYLDASDTVRTRRRADELGIAPNTVDFDDLKKAMKQRDKNDSTRELAPLKQALDAVYINSDNLSRDDVVRLICDKIKRSIR